ncbi:MAG: hypothetical protein GY820_35235, partial [Gammaproteobacteria bacterium]|nr:hypothetical protein [Gammaproteobacteria bacterium]
MRNYILEMGKGVLNVGRRLAGEHNCKESWDKLFIMDLKELKFQGIESVEPLSELTFKKHLGIDTVQDEKRPQVLESPGDFLLIR